VRLPGRAADVDAVPPCPRDDRQAAGALVAAGRRAGVAEQRVAHAPRGDRVRQRRGRDELVALAVGEDQHRATVAGDQRACLGRRAHGDLVGRAGRAGAQEGRQRGDARRGHRPGTARHLDAIAHGAHGRGDWEGEDRAQGRRARDLRPTRARANSERDASPEARGDGRVDAREVARAQPRHRAAQREAGDEPQPEREQPAAPDPIDPAPATERQRNRERRQRGDGLEAYPSPEMGVGGEQPQRPGRGRPARQRGGVLARAAREH
jgi:hypothetical protein